MNSLVADDAISEASVADLSRFVPKMHSSPSMPHVISIGQLLESVNSLSLSLCSKHKPVYMKMVKQDNINFLNSCEIIYQRRV